MSGSSNNAFESHYQANSIDWVLKNNNMSGSSFYALNYLGRLAELDGNDFRNSNRGVALTNGNHTGSPLVLTWQGTTTVPTTGPNKNLFGGHTSDPLSFSNMYWVNVSGWDISSLFTATATNKRGFTLDRVNNSHFEGNTLSGLQSGVYVRGSSSNTVVTDNDMSNCVNAFETYVHNGPNNSQWTVTDNIMTNASGWAITYIGSPADISGNDFTGSNGGINFRSANNFTLLGSSNTWDLADAAQGVFVEYTNGLTIQDLNIVGVGGTGIYARNGISNLVIDGLESCGKDLAVHIQSGSGNIVRNSSFGSSATGVYLQGTSEAQVLDNSFYNVTTEVLDNGTSSTISGSQTVTSDPWCQGPAPVPTVQTFSIYGGNGAVGDIDPYTQALPEGATEWQQAYLTGWHPWGFVSGTNSWVNFDPNDEVGINTRTPYRIRFMVPEDFTDPSMVFTLKADNRALIWINDTFIDSVDGQGSPSVDASIVEPALHVGLNEIRIMLVDWGGIVGLNYRVDVTMTSAEDITDAVLTPDEAVLLNNVPVADAGADQSLDVATTTLDGSGSSDPDGNILTYSWSEGGNVIATGVNPTISLEDGSHTITLTVSDGELSATDEVVVEVVTNAAPVASASIDQSFSCIVSTVDVTLDGSGSSDPDGDALTYNWTSASFTAALTGVAPTATLGGGTHSVVLTVDDGFGGTATDTMTVSIELDQTAPVITLNDGDTTAVVCLYSYVEPGAVVEDNCDTNPTLVIDASGVDTSLVGFYEVTYTATDESGNVSTAVRIVEVTNQAPVVENEIVGLTISFGDPSLTTTVDLGFVFTDPDAHVMTFTASNGDEGIAAMSFDGSVVTLDAVDLGETVITVTADDGCGGVTEYQFTLTVNVTASLSDAIVFGMDEAELKKDILVNSGNILVNNAYECEDDDHGDDDDDEDDHGDDDEDDDCGDAFELKFDKDVTVAGGYMVKANNIQIKNGTVINSDVYYNFVQDQGNITGDEYSPVDIPLYSTFPPFKSAPAGDNSITVGKSESLTLPPGDYRDIKIKKRGSLYLTGGVYNFRKLNMEEKAKLRIEAATEIRVEKNVKTGEEVYIGPANGSSITAANIIFYVDGDDDDDAAFKLGEESDIYATVWAPNGKVEIKKEVNGTGAFWGEEVKIDKESNLTLDSYFGGTTGNARVMAWVEPGIPTEYTLAQNYPNPFNPETTLEYSILEPGMVSLTVYNILGQEVAALVNEYQPEGFYQVRFDGSRLSSGTYIYVIQTADFRQAKKMVLLK